MAQDCPICLGTLEDPVVCPCAGRHAFCAACIQQVTQLTCPLCRDASEDVVAFMLKGSHAKASWGPQLLHGAREGQVHVVKGLLTARAKIDYKDDDGRNALHSASEEGHHHVVLALLSRRAGIKHIDRDGATALHHAAHVGHVSTVSALLDAHGPIHAFDKSFRTPLHMASYSGHIECVQLLLQRRADVLKEKGDGRSRSSLHAAAFGPNGHRVMRYLVDSVGVDLEQAVNDRQLLQYACASGSVENVAFVLDRYPMEDQLNLPPYGSNGNALSLGYSTPMFAACESGHLSVVRYLLRKRARPGTPDGSITPLEVAAEGGHCELVSELLTAGAARDRVTGREALDLAVSEGHSDVTKTLLEARVSPGSCRFNEDGTVAICLHNEQQHLLPLLIEHRASVNASDSHRGLSPLALALLHDCMQSAQVLLEARANPNRDGGDGRMPLHLAIESHHTQAVRLLLEKRARPNGLDCDGATPLGVAIEMNDFDAVKSLIEARASPNLHSAGESPMKISAHEVIDGRKPVAVQILQSLVVARAKLEQSLFSDKLMTPLMLFADEGKLNAVKVLVEAGASLRMPRGRSAVDLARAGGAKKVERYLIKAEEERASSSCDAKRPRQTAK